METKIMKMNVGNKMCDVVTQAQFHRHSDLYDPQYTAIHIPYEGVVLPIINKSDYSDGKPGIYNMTTVGLYNLPDQEDDSYSEEHIIDFSDAKNMKEIIEKSTMVKNLENKILENSDNITVVKLDDNDEPEMGALKEAINCKSCDLNMYAPRFNGNYQNDRRILSDNSITLAKLKKYGDALDMKMTLTIEDKSNDIPNPIGKVITVELTGGNGNE